MVTKAGGTVRHFKIGITDGLVKRISQVQIGCPTRIHSVLSVIFPTRSMAASAEAEMHRLLEGYRIGGEWFEFDMADRIHKAVFNETAREVIDKHIGNRWTWTMMDVAKIMKIRDKLGVEMMVGVREINMLTAYQRAKRAMKG